MKPVHLYNFFGFGEIIRNKTMI